MKKQLRHKGLNSKRRIDNSLPENVLNEILSLHGMHAKAISKATGLSPAAIHYRNRKHGIKLKDYRDGRGPIITRILTQYTVTKIGKLSAQEQQALRRSLESA